MFKEYYITNEHPYATSTFASPEQTRSRSSPVPLPEIAEIGIGDNLHHKTEQEIENVSERKYKLYNH